MDTTDTRAVTTKVEDTMSRLGVKQPEAFIYLKLLENGPTTVSELSRKARVPRATVHRLVGKLLQKGLVSQTFKGESRILVAENPSMIENLLISREAELKGKLHEVENIRKHFQDFLKDVESIVPGNGVSQVQIRYYEGRKNLQMVYREVLKSKHIHSFVNVNQIVKTFPENPGLFKAAMQRNQEMEMWEIIEDDSLSREAINNLHTRYYYKFIPREVTFTGMDIMVYDDRLALVNLVDMSAILINSPTIVNTVRAIHGVMWALL